MIAPKRDSSAPLGTLDISPTEQLHISIKTHRGAPAVDIRLHTLLSKVTGIYMPSNRGVTLDVEALEWVLGRLDEARGRFIAPRTRRR